MGLQWTVHLSVNSNSISISDFCLTPICDYGQFEFKWYMMRNDLWLLTFDSFELQKGLVPKILIIAEGERVITLTNTYVYMFGAR